MPRKRDKVLAVRDGGQYIDVQFQMPDGEWVIGTYKILVWGMPPAAVRKELDPVINGAPLVTYGLRPGAKRAKDQ